MSDLLNSKRIPIAEKHHVSHENLKHKAFDCMGHHAVPKEYIEKVFLQYYADGRKGEFFLADNFNNLKGFRPMIETNTKKIKDVAVSLVRAGFLKGTINRDDREVTVTISGITPEGLAYLRSLSKV
jgi:hypothetical protein